MATYRVTVPIQGIATFDVEADTPEEAARIVREDEPSPDDEDTVIDRQGDEVEVSCQTYDGWGRVL